MLLEIILLTVALGNLLLGIHLWFQVKDLYDKPGLLGFPVLGNLYYFYSTLIFLNMNSIEQYFSKLSDKYGNVWWHWVLSCKTIVISCPHLTEKLAFHPNLIEKPWTMYGSVNSFLNGPFGSTYSDNEWKQKKKEYNLSLKKTLIEGSYHEVFVKISKEIIEKILENPREVDAVYLADFFSMSTIVETHGGIRNRSVIDRTLLHRLQSLAHITSLSMAQPFLIGYLIKILNFFEPLLIGNLGNLRKMAMVKAEEDIKKLEDEDLKEKTELPFISTIVLRNKKNNEAWKIYKKELHELLAVGSHTVSVALQGAIVFMAQFPEIQQKAWEEQYKIFGSDTRDPTVGDLKEMQYLERFIKESFRFTSPCYIAKYSTGEIFADGVKIPAGTFVMLLLKKMRTDTTYWKEPEAFDPDRFLIDDVPKYSYTPFGVGYRSCPGMTYASYEIKVLLSFLIRRFKLSSTVKFEDLMYDSCIMNEIRNIPLLQFEERQNEY